MIGDRYVSYLRVPVSRPVGERSVHPLIPETSPVRSSSERNWVNPAPVPSADAKNHSSPSISLTHFGAADEKPSSRPAADRLFDRPAASHLALLARGDCSDMLLQLHNRDRPR